MRPRVTRWRPDAPIREGVDHEVAEEQARALAHAAAKQHQHQQHHAPASAQAQLPGRRPLEPSAAPLPLPVVDQPQYDGNHSISRKPRSSSNSSSCSSSDVGAVYGDPFSAMMNASVSTSNNAIATSRPLHVSIPSVHPHDALGSGVVRKRKSGAHVKKSSSSEKGSYGHSSHNHGNHGHNSSVSLEKPPPAPLASSSSSSSSLSAGVAGGTADNKIKSPFEKLNTLKLLLDCGHISTEEYQERKTQIINEMTGTSTERKKPSPKRKLQPIMKTVVPHNPPAFSRIMQERAEKLSFDVDTLEWHSAPTRVKIDLVPFATGQLRNAYFLQELGMGATTKPPHLLVAKFSIRDAEPSSYLSDVEMQAVCAHYASLYNEHEPPLKVYYAQSWLLKLRDRGDLVCSVEEYLPGAYVKYSNNNGYVGKETSTTEERERNTPQAFSHFTFVASDYRLMVVDIQGVNDSYTDPQIHTADGRGFGAGNLGTFGMEKFLESHRCNEVCRWLGLPSINKQYKPGGTAAPLYKMPFGKVIKKSTNRITEERNTFSRSVTVSEAFGGSDVFVADEMYSSSVSTCTTGSSSLLYSHQQQLLDTPSSAALSSRPCAIAGSGRTNGAFSVPARHQDAPTWWMALKRFACCCFGG